MRRPHLTSPDKCAREKRWGQWISDVGRPFCWTNIAWLLFECQRWCGQYTPYNNGKICAQVIGDEGISWLASAKQYAIYDIAWRRSHPDNAHTPQLMHACLGRCCLWLTNIAFLKLIGSFQIFPMLDDTNNTLSKHKRHDRYKKALDNVAYRCLTSLTQSALVFLDSFYRWPTSMSLS